MQGDTKAGAPLNSSQIALLSARLNRQIFCSGCRAILPIYPAKTGPLSVSDCQKVLLAVLHELTCHQQINRRLNKVFGNLVAAILVINYRKASVNL